LAVSGAFHELLEGSIGKEGNKINDV